MSPTLSDQELLTYHAVSVYAELLMMTVSLIVK